MKKKTVSYSPVLLWIPVFFVIVCVPLLVKAVPFYNVVAEYLWTGTDSMYLKDFFLIVKGWGLYLAAGLSLFVVLCMVLLGKNIRLPSKWLALPAGYLVLALISALLSKDHRISWKGAMDLHQPFPVLAGYIILFYYTCIIAGKITDSANEENHRIIPYILRCFLLLALLLSVTGLLQMAGHDPFSLKFIQNLCGLNNTNILDSERIYMTLYHPDYVGVMISMLIPMITAGFFLDLSPYRYGYGLANVLLIVCLFGSKTRSGLISFLITGLVFVILFFIRYIRDGSKKNHDFRLILFIGVLFCVAIGMLGFDNPFSQRFFQSHEKKSINTQGITGIETQENQAVILIGKKEYHLSWTGEKSPTMTDKDDKQLHLLPVSESEEKALRKKLKKKVAVDLSTALIYQLENVKDCFLIQVALDSSSKRMGNGYALYDGSDIWLIVKDPQEGTYVMMNRQGFFSKSIISEDAFPPSFYGFASKRGYIWSKTIPRLKSSIFIGKGPDMFPLVFPNQDYIARHLVGEDDTFINKPHNWYLQMSSETGVLSAFLTILYLLYYLWQRYRTDCFLASRPGEKRDRAYLRSCRILNAGAGLSVLAYMISALVNDSMVLCAPLFWVILGLGSALRQ